MKNKFILSALVATALCANATEDPVLMTINGKDVKLSEFEYMYHKNNKQQIEKESLNDYVDRFVVYKLKVADAEAAGLDTTAAFVKELNGHKEELVKPYLDNSKYAEPFLKEGYERMKKNLYVSHIMLPLMPGNEQKMDSIRNCVLFGEDFATLAQKYSSDQYSASAGGDLGMLWVGRFPYAFENAAYNTPVGQVSNVVKTQFGYHLIKVKGDNTISGKYRVAHIVKTYQRTNAGLDANSVTAVDATMDSIYDLLSKGADFAELAKNFSDDKRSGQNGGELGWFKVGQLVKAIEDKMLSTPVGQVSKPSKADYGVHLVKVLEYKPLGSYEEMKEELMTIINKDERNGLIQEARLNDLKADYNLKENDKFFEIVKQMLSPNGLDSAFVEKAKSAEELVAFAYDGGTVKMTDIAKVWTNHMKLNETQGLEFVKRAYDKILAETLQNHEKENIAEKYPEYANLLNEYKEGILLFEISDKKVWAKSGNDTEGLNAFFKKNQSKYKTWTAPKFKGLVVFSKNDSIENAVKDYMQTLGGDTVATALHKKFRRDIKIERHLTAKGENRFVDELMFGGPKAEKNEKYTEYFVLEGKIIEQPEEVADVRGQATTDYQTYLENQWVKELKSKYKVKINKKVLKLVKE